MSKPNNPSAMGRKGAKARQAAMTDAERRAWGQVAARARWGKKNPAKPKGKHV